MKIRYLDGPRLRRSLLAACEYAQTQRSELNRINVFPVPDGDTGTNLALTVRAIADHLRGNDDRKLSVVAQEAAQAAVLGARGNCGMMLSHFLLGFAESVRERVRIGPEEFAHALREGVRSLHRALERPVEGTILTVMRDTANAADLADQEDFEPLLGYLVEAAEASLERTPDLLPVLRRAGVVDAGAKGFVNLLEGVLLFMYGDPLVAVAPEDAGGEGASAVAEIDYPDEAERYRFCTEALVRGADLPPQKEVRRRLRREGDSLIVIRSGEVLKIHIHTDDPDSVYAYLKGLGTLVTHKAEDMQAQHATVGRAADGHVLLARRPMALMTDSACDLPEEVIRAHGIQVTPLQLMEGDRTYRDGIDITSEAFAERMARETDLPTTSQPAPAAFLDTLARAAEDGEEIVGVLLASGLSGTFGAAEAAASRFHGAPVHLMDSQGASLLEGLLVLKACELAEMAVPPREIVQRLEAIRSRSGLLFTLDRFDRLVASGRVGRGRAMLGSVLNVKPILELTRQGKIVPVARAVGRKRAREAMIDELVARVPDGATVRFGIVHVARPEVVASVTEDLRGLFGDVEILSGPITAVLATHLGLGAWGVAYLVED